MMELLLEPREKFIQTVQLREELLPLLIIQLATQLTKCHLIETPVSITEIKKTASGPEGHRIFLPEEPDPEDVTTRTIRTLNRIRMMIRGVRHEGHQEDLQEEEDLPTIHPLEEEDHPTILGDPEATTPLVEEDLEEDHRQEEVEDPDADRLEEEEEEEEMMTTREREEMTVTTKKTSPEIGEEEDVPLGDHQKTEPVSTQHFTDRKGITIPLLTQTIRTTVVRSRATTPLTTRTNATTSFL
jgi:hypothetical protein